ncbi:hypothetical protein FPV67DRAFT_1669525 [Lyophyllum atratum]|nr:hypothetical protein FPV67DRAFT_1669525 [Lyophyllum atratum]
MADKETSWRPFRSLNETDSTVKKEALDELTSPLISPSKIPPATNLLCHRRHSSTPSLASTTRGRPYPIPKQDTPRRTHIPYIMGSIPASGTWSHSASRSGRSHTPSLRSRQTPGTDATYSLGSEFIPDAFVGHMQGSSSSHLTSSLNGAIGETSLPSHPRHIRSSRSRGNSIYTSSDWTASAHPQQVSVGMQQHPATYPGVAGMNSMAFNSQDLSTNIQYDFTTNRNPSPDSNSSGSSTFCNTNAMFGGDYSLHRSQPSLGSRHSSDGYPVDSHQPHSSPSDEERLRAEIVHLRRRVGELEAECSRSRGTLGGTRNASSGAAPSGLPTPPPSASFQASWKARTETRRRMFCSLNRAGNALCAWHDSRRERREFPPRHAPPGYLNCGCTHEEALFEESLARHSVGSYYPGESVRMDPALRNPLLKLLQQRYGYQDGDFERNPINGDWVEGEGAAYWEQQAHSGSISRRRVDTERH